ncbi:hypothetical protein Acr_21g0008200 [Actinidia rufa]|uniref:Sialate O-acetylesterase domain-containing protein n=1 Tax=Actinidia rufa TaxID=165716 RepID=A0A7J0GHL9_9ERIC|nr:hypothetical protein Acr_21g0008200 [Actinidia rufa]
MGCSIPDTPLTHKAMTNFLFLMLLANMGLAQASYSQGKNIIILAGQSNISGRGGIVNDTWDGVIPPECRPNPAILRLSADLTWVEASDPLHRDIDVTKICGVGPGMAFANRFIGQELYQLVRRAAVAVQGVGRIQAMLWYQGESDTVSEMDAEMYKGRLEKFFMDLRADLESPMLPIIQHQDEGPFVDKVREAQLGTHLANVSCVDAQGLQLEPGPVAPNHTSTGSTWADVS